MLQLLRYESEKFCGHVDVRRPVDGRVGHWRLALQSWDVRSDAGTEGRCIALLGGGVVAGTVGVPRSWPEFNKTQSIAVEDSGATPGVDESWSIGEPCSAGGGVNKGGASPRAPARVPEQPARELVARAAAADIGRRSRILKRRVRPSRRATGKAFVAEGGGRLSALRESCFGGVVSCFLLTRTRCLLRVWCRSFLFRSVSAREHSLRALDGGKATLKPRPLLSLTGQKAAPIN
ncbi:hypothetical protein HPB48_018918 [Haemaphysalis longicornis]|uniref:Uncharacterized protein n=1 Tax=Haemaphysalis longicornis TaxID=44386 RepID=A0A9J6G323_HAELO|nr:hypothetical protein HPB48_018918 [Haemaphysalis longicornis]